MWPWAHGAAACSVQELAVIPRWKGSRPWGSGSHHYNQTNADKFTNPQINIHVKGTALTISDTILNNVKSSSALVYCFPGITVGKTEQILENELDIHFAQARSVKNTLNSSKNLCTFVLLFERFCSFPSTHQSLCSQYESLLGMQTVSLHSRLSQNFCQ